jgi:hypothetical protein
VLYPCGPTKPLKPGCLPMLHRKLHQCSPGTEAAV